MTRRDGDRVRVFSRNAKDWTDNVPLIVEAMLALPVTSATIDGEGMVVDERGVTDLLQFHRPIGEGVLDARSHHPAADRIAGVADERCGHSLSSGRRCDCLTQGVNEQIFGPPEQVTDAARHDIGPQCHLQQRAPRR